MGEKFPCDRKRAAVVDSQKSSCCEVLSRVPQGSVLGPLLFLIYINDLPSGITFKCGLFADDALLYNSRKKVTGYKLTLLNFGFGPKLELCAKTWQLSFNAKRCTPLSVG